MWLQMGDRVFRVVRPPIFIEPWVRYRVRYRVRYMVINRVICRVIYRV